MRIETERRRIALIMAPDCACGVRFDLLGGGNSLLLRLWGACMSEWKVFNVMLNLFQHLTDLESLFQPNKILKRVQDDTKNKTCNINIFSPMGEARCALVRKETLTLSKGEGAVVFALANYKCGRGFFQKKVGKLCCL